MKLFNLKGEWSPSYKVRLQAKLAMYMVVALAAAYIGIRVADGGAGWGIYAFFWIIAGFALIRALLLAFKLQELWEFENTRLSVLTRKWRR